MDNQILGGIILVVSVVLFIAAFLTKRKLQKKLKDLSETKED